VAAGVAALALVAGLAGGAAGQLGASAFEPGRATSAPAAATTAFAQGAPLSVGEVVAKLEPSVVAVDISTRSGRAAGTGVILTADGQVLTNAHVVEGATRLTVTLNGETSPRAATVVGADTATDLALLKISGASGLPAAPLGSSSSAHVGDEVVAIGNALALEGGPTVTKGIISGLDRSLDEGSGSLSGLLQTDASISSGNSGGPLIDASGSVIGINTAVAASSRSTSAENIGFAIAIDSAKPVIESMRSAGLPRNT
jgi:putative serine protease PepD